MTVQNLLFDTKHYSNELQLSRLMYEFYLKSVNFSVTGEKSQSISQAFLVNAPTMN